jgi:small subunit ribosomal protein S1
LTSQDVEVQDSSFSDLLDEYLYESPERGQILKATVIEVDTNEILLDVGLKRDAVVTRKDLNYLDQSVIEQLVPGKETYAYVLQPYNGDGELIVSINKALELEDWERAQELIDAQETITVTSVGSNRGGVLVRFGRLQGFIPNSHIYTNKSNIEGEEIRVKVIEIERRRNRLVFSEREAIFEEKKSRMEEMNVGDIVTGTVVHITDFGAFIDLGGADGLIHISNIVHQHISHPSQVLSIGQEIEVRIEEIDIQRERISLNRKVLLPDPWETFTGRNQIGDLILGRVTNVVDYGIFVAAPGGMEGLVHTSKMQSLKVSNPRDMFQSGDEVVIRILDIDFDRQRVQLDIDSIDRLERTAWLQEQGLDVDEYEAKLAGIAEPSNNDEQDEE